jgi:benzoate-CoA ligase family protein
MSVSSSPAHSAVIDRVPRNAHGSLEIGFTMPEQYNCSRVLFDNLARGNAGRPALHSAVGSFTYGELAQAACQLGNGLLALGMKRGERVLFLLDDTPVAAAAFFGAVRAGLVPVLLNTLSTPELIRYYAQDSGALLAVVDADLLDRFTAATVEGTSLSALIVVNGEPKGSEPVATVPAVPWLGEFDATLPEAGTHRDDMAFWMYSSGTTGRPKGIVHLQHDMAYTAASYGRHLLKLSPDDICFSVPKLFFAYGFGNTITFPFSVGASSVMLAGRPEPKPIFDTIRNFKPTVFFGLPTLYTALIKDAGAAAADLSSVRLCVSAAEVLAAEVHEAWARRFGQRIMEGLGSTEVLHIYLSNGPDAASQRLGSAGRVVPGYEVIVMSPLGSESNAGEEGVLWVRGDSSAPCYWNQPEKSAETMQGDGWINTGDRFARDADGYHYFKGRADDLVKVSGQWVYPLEVELALADHPAVRECAVLALEQADKLMTLKAFVVLETGCAADAATTAELQAFAKSRLLPYKYPRQIEYMAALPKTGTGKIDRAALKARAT